MKFLRFESEAAALSALAEFLGPEQQWPAYIRGAAVDVVGVVYRQTGGVLQTSYGPVPELAPSSGWHINLSERVPELQAYEIEPPATPDRVFSGAWPELEPVFPMEVTMRQCRLALFDQHGVNTDEDFYGLVNSLPLSDRPRALLELRTSPTVRRDSPLVQALAAARGWDLGALFLYAVQQ